MQMMAYGTAGLFGHGFDTVIISLQEAHTDFIFSVITLGFGFVGAIITLIAILALDVCILYVGLKATHQSDKYFIAGIFWMYDFPTILEHRYDFRNTPYHWYHITVSFIWWVFTFILHDCNWNVF